MMRIVAVLSAVFAIIPLCGFAQMSAYSEYVLKGNVQTIDAATKRYANVVDAKGREVSWIAWDLKGNVTQSGERFYAINGRVSEERIMHYDGRDTILYQYDFLLDGRLAKMLEGRKPEGRVCYHRYSYTSDSRMDSVWLGDTVLIRVETHRLDNNLPTKIQDFEHASTTIWTMDKKGLPIQEKKIENGREFITLLRYNKNGQLQSRANDLELIRYSYDPAGRLLETQFLDDDNRVVERWVRVYE